MPILKPGDKAPEFELVNQHDEKISLAELKGRKVLLYFYPKADTPGCTIQSCAVRDAVPDLGKVGVVPLGVSPDKPAAQKKFDEKYDLGFALLSDTLHEVAEAYGVWSEKSMYGKTFMGITRSSFLIDEDGKIEAAWYKVKPRETVPKAMETVA